MLNTKSLRLLPITRRLAVREYGLLGFTEAQLDRDLGNKASYTFGEIEDAIAKRKHINAQTALILEAMQENA